MNERLKSIVWLRKLVRFIRMFPQFFENGIINVYKFVKWFLYTILHIYKIASNKSLKGIDIDKLLIVGNGPSIADFPLKRISEIKNMDIMCLNYFPSKDERFWLIKPAFLCLMDSAFFNKASPEAEIEKKILFDILNRVDWHMYLVCKMGCTLPISNSNLQYIFLSDYTYDGMLFRKKIYSKNLGTYRIQNVVQGGLFLGTTLKARAIYLSGVESSYLNVSVSNDNEIYLNMSHSYDTKKVKLNNENIKYIHEYIRAIYFTFLGYYISKEYADAQKTEIYNLTQDSLIDVFRKKKVSELIDN
ncbi:MAG: hypothetical protein HFH59_10620 [Lachnospiraceae bacterium]|nr:hypothetical protein [Lachnospiraceae bacterium]